MPRPMSQPQFAKADQCPGCMTQFAADTPAVLSAGGTLACEHCSRWIVTAHIIARGPYAEIRRTKPTE